jgi:hypothetical protein
MSDAEVEAAARERLLGAGGETVAGVLDAADAVADDWAEQAGGRPATTDREAVVQGLQAALDQRGLLHELATLLATAVEATEYDLPARPVAAPPYVAITSTGPVLRATLPDGRLVASIDCFEVVRGVEDAGGSGIVYARTDTGPAAALSVSFARSPG